VRATAELLLKLALVAAAYALGWWAGGVWRLT
jgi:hypothetical protein